MAKHDITKTKFSQKKHLKGYLWHLYGIPQVDTREGPEISALISAAVFRLS